MLPEHEIQNWDRLPKLYQQYFASLYEEKVYGTEDIESFIPYLLDPSLNERRIGEVLYALDQYSVTPYTAQNPRVQQAWGTLQEFTQEYHDILARNNAVVSITGSVRYDDPRNLDFDVEIYVPKATDEVDSKRLAFEWSDRLTALWPVRVGGDMTIVSMEDLQRHHQKLQERDADYFHQNAWEIMLDYMRMDAIFNGYLGLSPSMAEAREMQQEIAALLHKNPLMQASALVELQAALHVRRERRGLLR